MRVLDVIVHGDIDPTLGHGFDMALLEDAPARPDRLSLRGYRFADETMSLGRYHLAPDAEPMAPVGLQRRLGGGRVIGLGPEFAILALTMPHRSALVGDDPLTLRPEQVLNRCVRGLLAGLRRLGVEAFYPGRDRVTVGRRMVGIVSLDVAANQATTCEAILAVENGWARFAERLAAADPTGVAAAALPEPDEVTTLAEQMRTVPGLDAIVHAVAAAFAAEFALAPQSAGSLPLAGNLAAAAATWIAARRPRSDLDRHASEWTQLGVLDVHARVRGATVGDVLIAGDFIADAPGIERLESILRGCPATRAAIRACVTEVYRDARHFLLGVGAHDVLVDTIVRATGALA